MAPLPYRTEAGTLVLFIRLTPKGGRDALEAVQVDADGKAHMGARVRAVPENGKANEALVALLARELDVKKSAISIVSGAAARQKAVRILGDPAAILARLVPHTAG